MKPIITALIGNGKSANRYQLPYILQRKDKYTVKTIYQRDLSVFKWKKIEDIQYTDDLNAMLMDPEIELVIITLPSHLHYEYAMKVLEAGKHCVVEKPFTETLIQAKELFDFARDKNLMIQCYQNRRFDSDLLTAQKVIKSGALGDLQEMELTFDYDRPEVPLNSTGFSRIHSYYYGHACHSLDQVISMFGQADRVVYDVRQLLGRGRLNDYFDVDMFYQNLKVSVKSSFFRVVPRPSLTLYGSNGMFIKTKKDKQEEHLKQFLWPNWDGFGKDEPEEYGILTIRDENGQAQASSVKTVTGDYGRYYDALYQTLRYNEPKLVQDEHTLWQLAYLEEGIKDLK